MPRPEPDVVRILTSQAVRAFGYGFGAVLLASTLADQGLSTTQVGLVLAALVAGTVLAQLAVARWADRWGRRRGYQLLYLLLGVSGVVLAAGAPLWMLVVVALTGALSAEVVESGPFTTLELSMLAGKIQPDALASGFGWYNAIAAAAGSLGALAAALPHAMHNLWTGAPTERVWFLALAGVAAVGIVIARRLTAAVEMDGSTVASAPLGPSRKAVVGLAGLFGLDAFAGSFVVQAFIGYWLIDHHHATTAAVAALFAAIGIIQTASFLAAPLLARRWGLLNTMVFTHLPSNLLLASVAFAPSLGVAAALLLCRAALSQMDIPTRQAYVMRLVTPAERTAATAYTNTARYLVRPIGPLAAGVVVVLGAGIPFLLAGTLKSVYDLTLWGWFRTVPLHQHEATP